jgi:hypothetical protein
MMRTVPTPCARSRPEEIGDERNLTPAVDRENGIEDGPDLVGSQGHHRKLPPVGKLRRDDVTRFDAEVSKGRRSPVDIRRQGAITDPVGLGLLVSVSDDRRLVRVQIGTTFKVLDGRSLPPPPGLVVAAAAILVQGEVQGREHCAGTGAHGRNGTGDHGRARPSPPWSGRRSR